MIRNKKDNLNGFLGVRVTKEEHKQLTEISNKFDISISQIIRNGIKLVLSDYEGGY